VTDLARRRWLSWLAALILPRAVGGQAGQQKTSGSADPLPNPDWVGRPRAVVDSADNVPALTQAERRLRCTCGCGLDVFTCRTTDFTCSYSPALHQEAVQLFAGGMSGDQVVEAFVAKYGVSILMAPKDRGFGALGYWLPGGALALAGAVLGWVLVRRARRAEPAAPAPAKPVAPVVDPRVPSLNPDELARLDRALRDIAR
jgi:cytochrome c-type biogenesis protein CcmH